MKAFIQVILNLKDLKLSFDSSPAKQRGFLFIGCWVDLDMSRYISVILFIGLVWGECDEGYTEYDGECYYDNDLSFLTQIIYLNDIEYELFYDIGLTIWQNGHINTLLLEGLSINEVPTNCLLYTSPSPRDGLLSRMPSSA